MKTIIWILCGVTCMAISCKGVKYCEGQKYDFLDENFNPSKAENSTYKQLSIKAENIPMNSRGKLTPASKCASSEHLNAQLLHGIKDDFSSGTRRIYENGKLLLEIRPSQVKKHLLAVNDFSQVSDAEPYYRSWHFQDFSQTVHLTRVNFLGKAQGHYEDFKEGMLKFHTFNTYASGKRREVSLTFSFSQEVDDYLKAHSAQPGSWVETEKMLLEELSKIETENP